MNKIIKNALILAAITLIAGLLLGAAHQVTLEPIQKQQEKEKQESCQNVFPEAASFEEVTMSDAEQAELTAALIGHGFEAQTIDELLLAKDASGATIGLVEIISTTEGYGGGMQFSMGIASDGTTKGISFRDGRPWYACRHRRFQESVQGSKCRSILLHKIRRIRG